MIDDPPLLTIRRNIVRPDRTLVDSFVDTPTGFLVDAMGGQGALDARIKAVPGTPHRFIGTALTCSNGPADNLALAAAVCLSEPGDVLVAATEGHAGCAVMGDLLLGMAKNRGVAAFVTDGMVRDLADIQALSFPCFAAGVTPNSAVRNGPGTVGLPIICGGRAVASGDIVIGDADGVVVVPQAEARSVLKQLKNVRAKEAKMLEAVRGGLKQPGFMADILSGNRVRYVDE